MLLQIIENIVWVAFLVGTVYLLQQLITFYFYMVRCRGLRFVVVPAQLLFTNEDDDDDDDDDKYTDPELARIYREANVGIPKTSKYKAVSIRYSIDLEEIRSFHEYTMDDHSKGTVNLNCTYVSFKSGNYVVLNYSFDQFEFLVTEYNNHRYNLL